VCFVQLRIAKVNTKTPTTLQHLFHPWLRAGAARYRRRAARRAPRRRMGPRWVRSPPAAVCVAHGSRPPTAGWLTCSG
ncbi:MAG: hypothetical protein MZW92_40945, partial [Comamonadaceae bacterium]|nr:hypothetical protein [Comamonadaceae bacterium]